MSNIVQFPTPREPHEYIEIDGGTVTKSDDASKLGSFLFFVSVVMPEDALMGVWDGDSYSAAVKEANEMSAVLRLPIIDRTGGAE